MVAQHNSDPHLRADCIVLCQSQSSCTSISVTPLYPPVTHLRHVWTNELDTCRKRGQVLLCEMFPLHTVMVIHFLPPALSSSKLLELSV